MCIVTSAYVISYHSIADKVRDKRQQVRGDCACEPVRRNLNGISCVRLLRLSVLHAVFRSSENAFFRELHVLSLAREASTRASCSALVHFA
jgi:hypothetical protein